MPHFGHVIVSAIVEVINDLLTGVLIGVLVMSSRSGIGRRDICWRVTSVVAGVGTDVHAAPGIDPTEPSNMVVLLAFE